MVGGMLPCPSTVTEALAIAIVGVVLAPSGNNTCFNTCSFCYIRWEIRRLQKDLAEMSHGLEKNQEKQARMGHGRKCHVKSREADPNSEIDGRAI